MRLPAWIDKPLSLVLFAVGAAVYALSGRSPKISYHAMRRLHGLTGGRSNRAMLRAMRLFRPRAEARTVAGFLGTFTVTEQARLVSELRRCGIVDLGRTVPAELCDELVAFARREPCLPLGSTSARVYPAESADALRYDFSERQLLALPAACRIVFDGTLAALAEGYFDCRPRYDFSAMWWTTSRGQKDFSGAAQMFHFDMDRPFFVKFFVYLTDVTEQNGPHVYVEGSHGAKPPSLREPRRFADAEVESCYDPSSMRVVTGQKGQIFAADTAGLHKGMPVRSGDRLVFQVEFAVNLFGQRYERSRAPQSSLEAAGLGGRIATDVFGHVMP